MIRFSSGLLAGLVVGLVLATVLFLAWPPRHVAPPDLPARTPAVALAKPVAASLPSPESGNVSGITYAPIQGDSSRTVAATIRLAVIGDSLSAGIPRTAIPTSGHPDLTWVDSLVLSGRAELGGWKDDRPGRPGPGWADLWAAWGVTAAEILDKPWLDELTARKDAYDAVLVFIGHNELRPLIMDDALTRKSVTDARIAEISGTYAANLARILDRLVLAHGQRVQIMLPADWTCTPFARNLPIPQQLSLALTKATHAMRERTMEAAVVRRLPTIDAETVLRRLVERDVFNIGGVDIASLSTKGTARDAFQADGMHFTTALHGRLANAILSDLGQGGLRRPPLTDGDILTLAGLARIGNEL